MHTPNWNMPPGWRIKQPSLLTSNEYNRECVVIQCNYYGSAKGGKWEVAFFSAGKNSFISDKFDVVLWRVKSFKSSPKT